MKPEKIAETDALPAMEWIRSARRSLELRVLADGRVELRTPWHTSRQEALTFVQTRALWLSKALAKTHAKLPPSTRKQFAPDAQHCLLGKIFPLHFVEQSRGRVRFEKDHWRVELPAAQWSHQQTVERLLNLWYRQAARPIFERLIDQHFPLFAELGYSRPRLTVRQMTSRWGSMSSQGALSLNAELMKYPLPLIEYVVVHELCHLKYMNHGAGFKALQARVLPDWQQRRQQLNAGLEIYYASDTPERG